MPPAIGLQGTFQLIEECYRFYSQSQIKPLLEGIAKGIFIRCLEHGVDLSSSDSQTIFKTTNNLSDRLLKWSSENANRFETYLTILNDPSTTRSLGEEIAKTITRAQCANLQKPPPSGGTPVGPKDSDFVDNSSVVPEIDFPPSTNWSISKTPKASSQPQIFAWKSRLADLKQRVESLKTAPWYEFHLPATYLQKVEDGVQFLEEFAIPRGDHSTIMSGFRNTENFIEEGLEADKDQFKAKAALAILSIVVMKGISWSGGAGEGMGGAGTGSRSIIRSKAAYIVAGAGEAAAGLLFYLDSKIGFSDRINKFSLFARHIPI